MCMADNYVNDCPKHLSQGNDSSHSIMGDDVEISLPMKGVLSGFNGTPINEEKENCTWINMTDISDWDLHSDTLETAEIRLANYMNGPPNALRHIYSISSSNQFNTFESDLRQISSVLTSDGQYENMMKMSATNSKYWKWKITPEKMAQLWTISLDAAATKFGARQREFLMIPFIRCIGGIKLRTNLRPGEKLNKILSLEKRIACNLHPTRPIL